MRTRGLVVVGLALVVLAGVAAAKPKVAVITFEGDPRGEAQDVVTEALSDDVQVVNHKEVNRTVDKLGLEVNDLADKDLRKLATELEVDAIIQGKLSKQGPNHLLHFKLFVHGKKQKGFKIEFGSLKSSKFKEKLRDKMVSKIGGDEGGAGETKKKKGAKDAKEEGDEENPLGAGKKKGDDAKKKKGDDDPLATMKKKGDDTDDAAKKKGDDGDDTAKKDKADKSDKKDDGDDGDKPRKGKKRTARAGDDDAGPDVEAHVDAGVTAPAHSANRVAFRLDVGGSGQHRTLAFTSRSFPQAPTGYHDKNPIVGGFRVEGELYPLAFGNPQGIAAGLGIGGLYDQNIGLKLTSSGQPNTTFPVTERRFVIGPRFRIVFGSRPTSPSLTLTAGFGRRTFSVDRTALMTGNVIDLPDVDYKGFVPGLEFRIPIIEHVALMFGGSALLLTSAGPIQNPDQYGQARVTGGEGMAGIDFIITNRIAVKVTGEATQIGFAFTGNGAQSNARDMDPSTKDVGGAADRYVGGALTLAVLY